MSWLLCSTTASFPKLQCAGAKLEVNTIAPEQWMTIVAVWSPECEQQQLDGGLQVLSLPGVAFAAQLAAAHCSLSRQPADALKFWYHAIISGCSSTVGHSITVDESGRHGFQAEVKGMQD